MVARERSINFWQNISTQPPIVTTHPTGFTEVDLHVTFLPRGRPGTRQVISWWPQPVLYLRAEMCD